MRAAGTGARAVLVVAVVLVAAHAVMLVRAAQKALAVERGDYQPLEFAVVALASLAVSGVALALFRGRTRAVALAIGVLAAVAVLTPGAVAIVALVVLNAHVVGTRIVRFLQHGGAAAPVRWTLTALAGIAVWIGLVAATAAMKVHYPGVYAVALLVPLVIGWQDARLAVSRFQAFAGARDAFSWTERAWVALLLTVFVVHAFMVARPDVGYDAQTMHLQIAMLVNDAHRFHFDVERYLWAVMPMGADWTYTVAYVLGGEAAARTVNLAFGIVACAVVFDLAQRHARLEIALATVCLLASTPLAFAETSSLYVENLWAAFLMAAALIVLKLRDGSMPGRVGLPLFALLAAGAMQCKVIGVLWLAPLAPYAAWLWWRSAARPRVDWRGAVVIAMAVAIAAWPYVNAWLRTGNPVFPFMNKWFKSPLVDAATSFDNPLYRIPLRLTSLYDVLTDSHRFLEGADGAAGMHWLLVIPLVLIALARRRPPELALAALLFAVFFVAVYVQQAYLRYLFPALMLLAVLGAWAASGVAASRAGRFALIAVGSTLVLLHIRLIPSGNWPNAQLCTACGFDRHARQEFVSTYMGDRIVADWLNQHLPQARVGFLMLNAPSPAGFVGYSRAANWHDGAFYRVAASAARVQDIEDAARRFGLTHIVYRTASPEMENPAMREFRESRTTQVWRYRDFVVAAVAAPR